MNVLDLFSGIGGFSVGLESTGKFKTIAFVKKINFVKKFYRNIGKAQKYMRTLEI